MTGIISSYFIEPVLRQARRFSSVARPTTSSSSTSQAGINEQSDIAADSSTQDEQSKKLKRKAKKQNTSSHRSYSIEHVTSSFELNNANEGHNLAVKDNHCTRQSHANKTPRSNDDPPAPPVRPTTNNTSTTVTSRIQQHNLRQSTQSPNACTVSSRPLTNASPSVLHAEPLSTTSAYLLTSTPFIASGTRQIRPIQRTQSLGALFEASLFSDRDCSTCPRHTSNASIITDFQHSSGLSAMDPADLARDRRSGSDTPATSRSDTNLLRHHFRTRRYSWTQATTPRNGPRRPPLVDHYTDSLLVAPDENSRSKQDEDIMSREGELRRKIQEIRLQSISNEEKAKRIHYVMNERYLSKIETRHRKKSFETSSNDGRALSPDSSKSEASSAISNVDLELYTKFNVIPADLVPTRRPRRHSEDIMGQGNNLAMTTISAESDRVDAVTPPEPEYELGCDHYKRNVKIQCYECKSWWNCRYCHDQADLGHSLPRHKTENMLCMLCQTPGPAGQYCEHCGEQSAYYFCEICKLWDDDTTKRIYHCTDCGICRLGEGLGKDFQHCKQFAWHKCLERATDCDCPICGDYMFTSKAPIVSMPCGHYLHRTCYNEYMLNSYQCPICKKSARNMESQWRKMEEEIARQPMPMNLRNVTVDVRCNDCGGKSRVSYHWLGNKCALCDTFNTTEIEIHRDGGGLTAASPSPPRGNWRTARAVPQRTVRRYFEDDEAILEASRNAALGDAAAAESLLGLPNTAYEILATMTRNLSPIRRYLNNRPATSPGEESTDAAVEGDLTRAGFWDATIGMATRAANVDAWPANVPEGEDDNESNDDDEEYESSEEEEGYLFDDDSDTSSEGGLGLDALDVELIGHR